MHVGLQLVVWEHMVAAAVEHHNWVGVESQHRHLTDHTAGVAAQGAERAEGKDDLVEEAVCCVFGTYLGDQTDHRQVEARMGPLACPLEQHLLGLHFS